MDFCNGRFIVFRRRQLEQVGVVGQPLIELIDGGDDLLQAGALLAQLLGVVRIVPDIGILELPGDFL